MDMNQEIILFLFPSLWTMMNITKMFACFGEDGGICLIGGSSYLDLKVTNRDLDLLLVKC